jgi:hypothetical protein
MLASILSHDVVIDSKELKAMFPLGWVGDKKLV